MPRGEAGYIAVYIEGSQGAEVVAAARRGPFAVLHFWYTEAGQAIRWPTDIQM